MRRPGHTRNRLCHRGFGIVELLVLLLVIVALCFLLPVITRSKGRTARINCISNVKQIGLSFKVWAKDHEGKFPWEVSTNEGGSMQFVGTPNVFAHFETVSNE